MIAAIAAPTLSEWDHLYRMVGVVVTWFWIAIIGGLLLAAIVTNYQRAKARYERRKGRCSLCLDDSAGPGGYGRPIPTMPNSRLCFPCALATMEAHRLYQIFRLREHKVT